MEKWRQLKIDTKVLIAGFLILGILAFLMTGNSEKSETATPAASSASVDTFIPRGFILVPIELTNADSLSSMVGDVGGVVDLYLASSQGRKGGLKIASRVKLLRAPLNPQQYAVLISESEGPRLLSFQGPFTAVIQNPESRGAHLADAQKKSIHIDYQN